MLQVGTQMADLRLLDLWLLGTCCLELVEVMGRYPLALMKDSMSRGTTRRNAGESKFATVSIVGSRKLCKELRIEQRNPVGKPGQQCY
jgi:hypothetical protein